MARESTALGAEQRAPSGLVASAVSMHGLPRPYQSTARHASRVVVV